MSENMHQITLNDQFKYMTVAHTDLRYGNPISASKYEEILSLLDLPPNACALDIGSGKAEFLIRLIRLYDVTGTAIDHNPHFLREAYEQATKRIPDGQLELAEMDARVYEASEASYDIVICLGCSDIFGSFARTLKKLAHWTKPGGYVVIAHGFWKKEPSEEYLNLLGGKYEQFGTHAGNVATAVAQGLTPLYAAVASDEDRDHYEWLNIRAIERYCRHYADDPDLLQRTRAWRDIYLQWGRDTLGFACYLLQK